jgi:hypothetical protein
MSTTTATAAVKLSTDDKRALAAAVRDVVATHLTGKLADNAAKAGKGRRPFPALDGIDPAAAAEQVDRWLAYMPRPAAAADEAKAGEE